MQAPGEGSHRTGLRRAAVHGVRASDRQLDALRRHGPRAEPACQSHRDLRFRRFRRVGLDGRLAVFGLPRVYLPAAEQPADLPARQIRGVCSVVVASAALPAMLRFYEEDLGFVVSTMSSTTTRRRAGVTFRPIPSTTRSPGFRSVDAARPSCV